MKVKIIDGSDGISSWLFEMEKAVQVHIHAMTQDGRRYTIIYSVSPNRI